MYLFGTGKRVEAEAKTRQIIELDPNFWLAYLWLACDRMAQGLFPEALPFAEKAYSLAPSDWSAAGLLAGILDRIGTNARTKQLLERLGDRVAFGAPMGWIAYYVASSEM